MRRFHSNRIGVLSSLVVSLFAASGALAQEPMKLNVLMPTENTTSFYTVQAARELGFFEEEGVDVTFLNSNVTVPFVAFLSTRDADAVLLDSAEVSVAVEQDRPIAVVYEAMQHATEGMAVAADSDIQSMADLRGKMVGLAGDRDRVTLQIALDSVGIGIDEVETAVLGEMGPTLANAFRNKTVDAVAATAIDFVAIEANGIALRQITPDAVMQNPANSWTIASDRVEELRPALNAFFRAWAKGVAAGRLDREAVAEMCRRGVPEQWEDESKGRFLLDFAVDTTNLPRTGRYGETRPEVWENVQQLLVKLDILETAGNPSEFLDNSFIDVANSFDEAEVREALEKWRAENPDVPRT